MPENAEEPKQFVEDLKEISRVPTSYKGEGLPALTQKMLVRFDGRKKTASERQGKAGAFEIAKT